MMYVYSRQSERYLPRIYLNLMDNVMPQLVRFMLED